MNPDQVTSEIWWHCWMAINGKREKIEKQQNTCTLSFNMEVFIGNKFTFTSRLPISSLFSFSKAIVEHSDAFWRTIDSTLLHHTFCINILNPLYISLSTGWENLFNNQSLLGCQSFSLLSFSKALQSMVIYFRLLMTTLYTITSV